MKRRKPTTGMRIRLRGTGAERSLDVELRPPEGPRTLNIPIYVQRTLLGTKVTAYSVIAVTADGEPVVLGRVSLVGEETID